MNSEKLKRGGISTNNEGQDKPRLLMATPVTEQVKNKSNSKFTEERKNNGNAPSGKITTTANTTTAITRQNPGVELSKKDKDAIYNIWWCSVHQKTFVDIPQGRNFSKQEDIVIDRLLVDMGFYKIMSLKNNPNWDITLFFQGRNKTKDEIYQRLEDHCVWNPTKRYYHVPRRMFEHRQRCEAERKRAAEAEKHGSEDDLPLKRSKVSTTEEK